MKCSIHVLRFSFCVFVLLFFIGKLNAQCNADFNYNTYLNSVNCFPKDSIVNGVDSWYIGNDSVPVYVGYNFNYSVSIPGTYLITHIVYDSLNACRDTASKSVNINFMPTCTADFYAVWQDGFRDNQYFNQYFIFSQAKTLGTAVTNYSWLIDNAEVSTDSEFLFKFSQQGLHTVCLKIKTASGCVADTCKPVMSFNNCNDTISFTHHVNSSLARTIDFAVSSPLPHAAYYWYFDSLPYLGYYATGVNVRQSFPSTGNYKVTLYQLDSVKSCLDTTSQNITINPLPCDTVPQLYFWYEAVNDSPLQTIHFHCNDSLDAQHWSFISEDSSFYATVDTINPVYTFPHKGQYHTCVRVSHTNGCNQEFCFWVHDSLNTAQCDSTTLSFNYTQNVNNPKQFSFYAISNKSIASESWHITKGFYPYYDTTINTVNPIYNFTDTGRYQIYLTAFFDSSCTKIYFNSIFIYDTAVNSIDTTLNSNTLISYPNPANNKVTFNMQLNSASAITIYIYNLNGRNVYSSRIAGLKGLNTITIPVQNLPTGQYFIDINNNGQRKKSIFQKF